MFCHVRSGARHQIGRMSFASQADHANVGHCLEALA
jgi:hypothetical protein